MDSCEMASSTERGLALWPELCWAGWSAVRVSEIEGRATKPDPAAQSRTTDRSLALRPLPTSFLLTIS